ncbi:MAG TPA: hypothetical protein VIL20_08090 [Sandaracinaceae bacterium]
MRRAKHYRSIEEFEREEIRSQVKLGWSLDDLYHEASLDRRDFDPIDEPAELNFDF